MKKIFMLIGLMVAGSIAKAADPVSIVPGLPESGYNITHSTVQLTVAVATDTAVSGYRKICTYNLTTGTTFFYKVDSTQTITSNGWPILPRTQDCLEYNGAIYWSLATGASAADSVRKIIRK